MKKAGKLLSVLLATVLAAGTFAAVPLSVGAVTAVSDGTVSAKVWQDVKFSDILTEEMSSDEIAAKLGELGIVKRSGNVTYSFANGRLVIAATSISCLDLARDSSLKSTSVQTDLGGVVVSKVADGFTSGVRWAYLIMGGTGNDNCYKMQLQTGPVIDTTGYTLDPAIKAAGGTSVDSSKHLAIATTKDEKTTYTRLPAKSAAYTENVKTPMDLSVSIDYNYGMYTYINGQLAQTMTNSSEAVKLWQANVEKVLGDYIQLQVNAGATIELESVCVRERMPELTITEVMTNGVTAVEVYNSTLKQVNVYDHCLYVSQSATCGAYWQVNSEYTIGGKWGTNTETVAYPIAGEHTYNYTTFVVDGNKTIEGNDTSVTLTNPAYEDGILNPGECAVLYIPSHAIGTSEIVAPKTLDGFKEEYNIASKVFYCYSDRDLAIGDRAQLGIGRVTFEGDDKSAPTVDGTSLMNKLSTILLRASDYGIYDSFVTVNATANEVSLRGVKYPTTGNAAGSSAEFLTVGRCGNVLYPSGTARTVNGAEVLHSLGTVLEEQKVTFTSTLTDLYGRESKVTLDMGATKTLPAIEGAEWKNSKGETVTEIAANTEDTYTQVTDKTVVFCGAQATKTVTDGTYSVRLIAVVDSIDFDAVDFEATVAYGEGETQTVTGTCHYVYNSILGDGVPYEATDFGGSYFVVLHVDGIPASVASSEWTVRVYTVSGDAESAGIGGSVTVDAPAQTTEG